MSELEQLIITASRLVNTLDRMAHDERKFGADMCHVMEQISYDFYKSTCELREISEYCVGVV